MRDRRRAVADAAQRAGRVAAAGRVDERLQHGRHRDQRRHAPVREAPQRLVRGEARHGLDRGADEAAGEDAVAARDVAERDRHEVAVAVHGHALDRRAPGQRDEVRVAQPGALRRARRARRVDLEHVVVRAAPGRLGFGRARDAGLVVLAEDEDGQVGRGRPPAVSSPTTIASTAESRRIPSTSRAVRRVDRHARQPADAAAQYLRDLAPVRAPARSGRRARARAGGPPCAAPAPAARRR